MSVPGAPSVPLGQKVRGIAPPKLEVMDLDADGKENPNDADPLMNAIGDSLVYVKQVDLASEKGAAALTETLGFAPLPADRR